MKTIKFLVLLLFSITLFSCGHDIPKFNDPQEPFVVGEIERWNQTHSIYYGQTIYCRTSFFGSWYQAAILPSGMYNIGDTITLTKLN